ncbi:hypothetical protein Syun_003913 [Stephania yunnanensis]|uniref:Uncharacterized protein n=1 Tax=Stephania yunnanensis TaxID=152371 RepID=A0AAP0L243_9MAGN
MKKESKEDKLEEAQAWVTSSQISGTSFGRSKLLGNSSSLFGEAFKMIYPPNLICGRESYNLIYEAL